MREFWEAQKSGDPDAKLQALVKPMGDSELDLVRLTALTEAAQELLHQENPEARPKNLSLGELALSVRHTHGAPVSTLEFVVPVFSDRTDEQLRKMINRNSAPDASEHTAQFREIKNTKSLKDFIRNLPSGWFLYLPVLCQLIPKMMAAYAEHIKQKSLSPKH